MARKLNGIELTRYDDLFKTDAERETDHQERVQIVPAEQVFPYARQPYSVDRPSADLVRLMDSIERTGIAEPLIVRPRSEGGYEIISGHRRDYCAKVVGLDTRPVIVRNYSDEDADILVVDYNINRENLLPSEKAKAYKLKLDAMKRQGERTDLTSGQLGQKFQGRASVDILAEQADESRKQIQRYRWSKAETEKPQTQQSSLTALWEAQQQLNTPRTRTGKIRALQESAALFSFLQANGIQSMQQLHEKIADMNTRYYDLRGKIVKAERRIAVLTERGEMWAQYNKYKTVHKQIAKVKPEKRELFEQRHSRELILYDAAARYLKELKDSGEAITPKAWQREIDQLAAGKQADTLAMKSMREELKAVERLRKTAEQLSRQELDKPHDREPER